ncbi:MAG: 50S ribosomal protein L21 [Phycisphaerales bacterium JB058]|jgi:large subunit ribosomal protein L21
MYAIIQEGGGQRKVTEGQELFIDLIQNGQAKAGDTITFDKVLFTGDGSGKVAIGQPFVDGASVTAEVIEPEAKGLKLNIYKFKPKVGYRRKTGHRQRYTHVKITSVTG